MSLVIQDHSVALHRSGIDLTRAISPGDRHDYKIFLAKGEAIDLAVLQQGVDVELTWTAPDEIRPLTIDNPNGLGGQERVVAVAQAEGTYYLEVAAMGGSPASYRISSAPVERASSEALAGAEGLKLYYEALGRSKHQADLGVLRAAFAQARQRFGEAGEKIFEARAYWRIGQVLLEQGDIDGSVSSLQFARPVITSSANGWEQASFFNLLGEALRHAGEYAPASEAFEAAITAARPIEFQRSVVHSLNNIGVLHASVGEVQKALEYYDLALEESQKIDPEAGVATLQNLGVHYVSLGRLEEGLDFLTRALAIRRKQNNDRQVAVTLTSMGWAAALSGDLGTAVSRYYEALELRRSVGDRRGEAVTLDHLGALYLEQGQVQRALETYSMALENLGDEVHRDAHIILNYGKTLQAAGQTEAAESHFRQALEIFRSLGSLNGEATALAALATVRSSLGHFDEADALFVSALEITTSVRGRLQSRWLRTALLEARYDVYSEYIEFLMLRGASEGDPSFVETAFDVSEEVRARGLAASLSEARLGLRQAAPDKLRQEELALRARINAKEAQRFDRLTAGDGEQAARLEKELRSLVLAYEKVQGKISALAKRPVSELLPLRLAAIQREVLDDETILLSYILGETRSFLWVVGSGSFEYHVLPPRSTLDLLAHQAYLVLSRERTVGFRQRRRDVLQTLSRTALGPAASRIEGKRLVIVADGRLQYVPFAGLPLLNGAAEAERFVLDEHQVVHIPSASVLSMIRRNAAERTAPPPMFLAMISDPVYQTDDPRLDRTLPRTMDSMTSSRFWRLAHAADEAASILALSDLETTSTLTGLGATREALFHLGLDRFRYVHFATHGTLNPRHPTLSSLELSRFDRRGRPIDSSLRLHDLFDLQLNADLVVLSACQTALGRPVRGEGLVGLPQGWFYAGASRLIVSFWNIDDRATAELMKRTYQGILVQGLKPSAALHRAQLTMKSDSEWREPYFWAGFTLQGEWN